MRLLFHYRHLPETDRAASSLSFSLHLNLRRSYVGRCAPHLVQCVRPQSLRATFDAWRLEDFRCWSGVGARQTKLAWLRTTKWWDSVWKRFWRNPGMGTARTAELQVGWKRGVTHRCWSAGLKHVCALIHPVVILHTRVHVLIDLETADTVKIPTVQRCVCGGRKLSEVVIWTSTVTSLKLSISKTPFFV